MDKKTDYVTVRGFRVCQEISYANGSRQVIDNIVLGDCSGNFIARFADEVDMFKFIVAKIKEQEEKRNG